MTKKRHEAVDETKKSEAGEAAENMDINSQEVTDTAEEKKDNGEGKEQAAVDALQDENVKESPEITVKETIQNDSPEVKLAEMQDKYLRLSAEFDNYRKRTLREKIELTKHAGENILISIIPVMDDFERAMKSMESSTDSNALKAGIDLIHNKFSDFLRQHGIKEIESLHTEFNVDLHEAVSKTKVDDDTLKGKVVEVLQKGYFLHDKVMRFSKVVVGE